MEDHDDFKQPPEKMTVSNSNSAKSRSGSGSGSDSNPPYYSNASSFCSEDHTNRAPLESLKYKQDIESLPASLFRLQLTWNTVYDLLMRQKHEALTCSLSNNIKYSGNHQGKLAKVEENDMINKNDTIDSTDTVDEEPDGDSDHKEDEKTEHQANIMMDPYDQMEKQSFVATYDNELVFVKITKSDEYRQKLITNMSSNERLRAWWMESDQLSESEKKQNAPFLCLRGWYLDDCSSLTCIIYPYAIKLSAYLEHTIVGNSDFAEFEQFETDEEQHKINWDLNLHHMRNLRDSLFKLAEFLANLHFDGASHRNVSFDNVFVDMHNATHLYLINYAQCGQSTDMYLSPEAHDYLAQRRASYSASKNDVWAFGCLLLQLFGHNAELYIQHLLHHPALLDNQLQTQTMLESCLQLNRLYLHDAHQQSKLKCILSLLLSIFTTQFQRYNMEHVCEHPFFAHDWSMI